MAEEGESINERESDEEPDEEESEESAISKLLEGGHILRRWSIVDTTIETVISRLG
jgi:hypothetical protein